MNREHAKRSSPRASAGGSTMITDAPAHMQPLDSSNARAIGGELGMRELSTLIGDVLKGRGEGCDGKAAVASC